VQDASQIVRVRLPDALMRCLDRSLDWRATARRVTSSRNAAIREALRTWLDEQEPRAGVVSPETLRRQFRAAYDRVGPSQDWVPIHRLRQQLQWPAERFDAVLEGRRAERHVARARGTWREEGRGCPSQLRRARSPLVPAPMVRVSWPCSCPPPALLH